MEAKQITETLFAVVVPAEAKILAVLPDNTLRYFLKLTPKYIPLGKGDLKLLGEVTHESISFDCYIDIRSLLASKGLYWDNEPRPVFSDYGSLIQYQGDVAEWQAAESKKLTKEQKLIIIEKI